MGIPGEEGGQYVSTGIEHDEYGHPGYTPEIHVGMQTKRWAKLDPLANGLARHELYGDEQPEIAIIGFGSTYGAVREAVDLRPRPRGSRWARSTRACSARSRPRGSSTSPPTPRRVVVPEVNFTGQLARLVRSECGLTVESHAKCDGLPFTAEDVQDLISERIPS